MFVEKPLPLSPFEELVVRFASVIIGLNVWLGLWMLFNTPQAYAVLGGFASYIAFHLIAVGRLSSPATRRFDESRECYLRRRIGELQEVLAELEQKKGYRG